MTTLNQLLTAELHWCVKHTGYERRRIVALGHGLSLVLYVGAGGENHLQLRRVAPTWPGDNELETVLRHWPQQPAPKAPETRRSVWHDLPHRIVYNCVSLSWTPERATFGEGRP